MRATAASVGARMISWNDRVLFPIRCRACDAESVHLTGPDRCHLPSNVRD